MLYWIQFQNNEVFPYQIPKGRVAMEPVIQIGSREWTREEIAKSCRFALKCIFFFLLGTLVILTIHQFSPELNPSNAEHWVAEPASGWIWIEVP